MKNHHLEEALMFAGKAGDIDSLKSLARLEGDRADRLGQILTAVLAVSGPIRLPGDITENDALGYSFTRDGDGWVVEYKPQPNRGL